MAWAASSAGAVVAAVMLVGCGGGGPTLSAQASDGRRIAQSSGCTACHGADGNGGIGPTWVGLAGSTVRLAGGASVVADDAYLRRAITEPKAEIVAGYTIVMPPNSLGPQDVEALVSYIESLQ